MTPREGKTERGSCEETLLSPAEGMESFLLGAQPVAAQAESGGLRPPLSPPVSDGGASGFSIAKLRVIDANDFHKIAVAPREYILEPLLRAKDLMMLFGARGIGKSYFTMAFALAVATGNPFLRWKADRPRKVLYVDGELQLHDLQRRMNGLCQGELPTKGYLRILSADYQVDPIPSLATDKGQAMVSEHLLDAEVVFLDNLASLTSGVDENDAKDWNSMQGWLLQMRRDGRSVCFVHHESKRGGQRGTSHREDIVDTVIRLAAPPDYKEEEGARFSVTFTKHRGFFGKDASPFEIALECEEGDRLGWVLLKTRKEKMAKLYEEGNTMQKIGEMFGVNKSTVSDILRGDP